MTVRQHTLIAALVLLASGSFALAGTSLPTQCPQQGSIPVVATFNFTGTLQEYTIHSQPISQVFIQAWGGQGGSGGLGGNAAAGVKATLPLVKSRRLPAFQALGLATEWSP